MKGGVRQMKNIKGDYYRRGSVSMIAIMAILFFVVVLAAIMPMTNTETKFAAANRNDTEARYAAEAGAKRAISEMLAEQTSWGWLEETKGTPDKQRFVSDKPDSDYYYSVYIEKYPVESPSAPLTGKPVIGQQYKITSTGYVNGSKKVISVIYKMNAGGQHSYKCCLCERQLVRSPIARGYGRHSGRWHDIKCHRHGNDGLKRTEHDNSLL